MMPTPGAPNGGDPNPRPDAEPDASETNSETTGSNISIQEHEFGDYYVQRHGRLFHSEPRNRYFLPADIEESTRLREQHEIFRQLLGGDYYQPLANKLDAAGDREVIVLDLGCGPGTWVEEFSDVYSDTSASFIGVDLVPMARQHIENAHFECYDISARRGIRPPDGDVGAIHARCLSFGYSGDFNGLLRDAHRVLSGGGLLLSIEIDWRLEQQSHFPRFNLQATLEFLGRVAECAAVANGGAGWDPTLIPGWLVDAGFQNVQREVRLMPVGQWTGSQPMQELGGLVRTMCIRFAEAMRPALLGLPGADPTQVHDLLAEVSQELVSGENTGWSIPVHLVTAYKGPTY